MMDCHRRESLKSHRNMMKTVQTMPMQMHKRIEAKKRPKVEDDSPQLIECKSTSTINSKMSSWNGCCRNISSSSSSNDQRERRRRRRLINLGTTITTTTPTQQTGGKEKSSKICIGWQVHKRLQKDAIVSNNNITPTILLSFMLMLASLMAITITEIGALKVSVSIPELVKLNDAFWLNCSHQMLKRRQVDTRLLNSDQDQQEQPHQPPSSSPAYEDIYAIKWFKDDEEFYRFLPNSEPKVSIYETNGIQLDQTKSHEGNVFISKADVNSEGNYRCEILSEALSFETVRKSKHLKVYALPVRGPRIEILDSSGRAKSPKAQEISYAVGDKIELRCNSAPSKPAARLRWYLNDHELIVPTNSSSSSSSSSNEQPKQQRATVVSGQPLAYDVRVTPIEYRQHYKGIYSSHSTLSLVLQQDDLINNKISFKCLASMRRDVSVRSKQLIVLTPHQNRPSGNNRARRSSSAGSSMDHLVAQTLGLSSDGNDAHVYHRQRPQHHRHSVSRLSPQPSSSSSRSQSLQPKSLSMSGDLINNLPTIDNNNDSKSQLMYIYEDADSTLGPSITDRPENLETYLRRLTNETTTNEGGAVATTANNNNNNYALEFNRADNLEYIQLLRERLARQRSFPATSSQPTGASGGGTNLKRLHGSNSLVKSPLYLDETDSLRPIISWPPLDSGKLMLLPPGNTIVAIPTPFGGGSNRRSSSSEQQRFILPSKVELDPIDAQSLRSKIPLIEGDNYIGQIILERLAHNLNCTCTDGSIDTKLGWIINDSPLETRDTRFYPTRVSSDHRQTWLTVGLQTATIQGRKVDSSSSSSSSPARVLQLSSGSSTSLQSILAQYFFRSPESQSVSSEHINSAGSSRLDPKPPVMAMNNLYQQPQQPAANSQIQFACQAIHSMLLYSSSEMITFDFSPPPLASIDGNSIDKFASLPSNVIQATSASQSSSANGWTDDIVASIRSQITIISIFMSIIFMYIS